MDDLVRDIENVKKVVSEEVSNRLKEFRGFRSRSSHDVFKELCFCLMTANFNAEKSIRIQNIIGDGFITYSLEELSSELRRLGHRFPNTRAKYIYEARKYADSLKDTVYGFDSGKDAREWLIKNIKGLGMKEASHFLRNIGFEDVAIIDFHIVDLLERYGVIERPKTLTKKKYLEIERVLEDLSTRLNVGLGELDLYLWYMETGKVLK